MYEQLCDGLKRISEVLRGAPNTTVFVDALCDMLFLYAHTKTYFTPTKNYKKFKSREI